MTTKITTFMDALAAGDATAADLGDWIERWHEAPLGSDASVVSLHEFLGMTWEEYARWGATCELPVRDVAQR
jgi:hypothetical protein